VKAQRLRVLYRLATAACGMSNRELVTAWESAVRDASYALSYSEGRRPSPQVALAAPLPLGVTSDGELADIFLEQATDPGSVASKLNSCLPEGIQVIDVSEVGVDGPSLQSQLRRAEYEVVLQSPCVSAADVNWRAAALLDARSIPTEYTRANKVKSYDLRPLILSIAAADQAETTVIHMRLRAEQENTARADQVLLALGIAGDARIHRTRLELEAVPAVLQSYRRVGEPAGEGLA
jgi:radical SAM-linked protein